MPKNTRVGAGGGGLRRSKSADLIHTVLMRTKYPSASAKLTEEEVVYLAELIAADDEAPEGLLEKIAKMEDQFVKIREYEAAIAARK